MLFFRFLAIVFVIKNINAQRFEGDACTLSSNEDGICKNLYDCPSALELVKNRIRPDTCSFEQNVPIVCCKIETSTTTSRTTSTTTFKTTRPVGAISKEKCEEYGRSVFQMVKPPILVAGFINISTCAQTHIPLIVGGEKAKGAEFPHQALLGYEDEKNPSWNCGGTLISENYVLTAAHCISHQQIGRVHTVRLGELDYNKKNDEADPQDFKIEKVIIHPERKPPLKYHDIALLKLDRPVKFNKFIRPACLHTQHRIPPTNNKTDIPRFIATGWGRIKEGGDASSFLMKVVLDYFPNNECTESYKSYKRFFSKGIDDSSQLCAGGRDEDKDTCQGDSGGPLQIYNNEVYCMYNLVGVTSLGKGCGVTGVPAIYTRVSNYIEWIENIVWPQ